MQLSEVTIKTADKNGIVYMDYLKNYGIHLLCFDKRLFKYNTLRHAIKRTFKYVDVDLNRGDIHTDISHYNLYNPENIDIISVMWFDSDVEFTEEEMLKFVQSYRRVNPNI